VVLPSTPYDAKGLIVSAIRDPDPVLFFEPKRLYRAIKEEVPDEEYTVPIGVAKVIREGSDVTVISWGAMVREVLRAAEMIEKEGVKAEVIDLRTISPLDDGLFLESVRKTGRAVIVHEAPRTCGLGAEIIARINEKALLSLTAPVERVTGFDTVVPLMKLENHYLPSPERILRGIRKVMAF
jgi:pyruvate dehydrogenase E1 component beta subunit